MHNHLHDSYQSAYRRGDSENNSLESYSDIAEALGELSTAELLVLVQTRAFEVIDHPVLLKL